MGDRGLRTVFRHVLDGTPLTVPQATLTADWLRWLKDNYGGYTQVTPTAKPRPKPTLPPKSNP